MAKYGVEFVRIDRAEEAIKSMSNPYFLKGVGYLIEENKKEKKEKETCIQK